MNLEASVLLLRSVKSYLTLRALVAAANDFILLTTCGNVNRIDPIECRPSTSSMLSMLDSVNGSAVAHIQPAPLGHLPDDDEWEVLLEALPVVFSLGPPRR